MPDPRLLGLFLAAALALLLAPGPAVLFVVTRSVQHGRAAGLVSTLGLSCGGLVHLAAALLGLSALLATSAMAFDTVRWLGAGYLVFLGIKALRSRHALGEPFAPAPVVARSRHFVDGLVVNVLNPKAAIFFLAFLPQFVDPERGPVLTQLAILGLLFVLLALLTDGLYAVAASSARQWLFTNRRLLRYEPYVSAAIYFGLGVSAALTGRRAE